MVKDFNQMGSLLRQYKVNYISGLPDFLKLKRHITMQLCTSGFVISGRAFPLIQIPYSSVVKFDLVVGYGSKWDYRPSDMSVAKVIDMAYLNDKHQIIALTFELSATLNVFRDHQTRSELIPFLKSTGIYDQFNFSR